MVGAFAARAGVLRLDRLDECARKLEVVFSAHPRQIGREEPGGAHLGASAPNVTRELTEALVRYRFPLVPDDHCCPAKRVTARRTAMTESMSARFSRR